MSIFDGLMNPAAVGGAFAQGLEQGRAEKAAREVKGALSAYAVNPDDPNAFKVLAQYKPELAIQIGADQRKRQEAARMAQLQQRAAAGDKAALSELSGVDLDAFVKLDRVSQDRLKQRVDFIGQAALAVKQLPPEAQPAAWDQYIQQGVQMGHADLAEYQGKYSPQAVDAAIAQSGLVNQALTLARPDYQVIPEGGTLVDTKRPEAVAAFAQGQVDATRAPISKEDFDKLPPGAKFMAPDGTIRQKPGGQTVSPSGTFRPVADGKAVVQQLFPGARITDNKRPVNSALGRANPGSWHVKSGGAVDIAPIRGMTFEQYVNRVKAAGYRIIEARDEVKNPSSHATGPHWHIVIGEA